MTILRKGKRECYKRAKSRVPSARCRYVKFGLLNFKKQLWTCYLEIAEIIESEYGYLHTRIWLSSGQGTLFLDRPSLFSLLPLPARLSSELMCSLFISTVNQILVNILYGDILPLCSLVYFGVTLHFNLDVLFLWDFSVSGGYFIVACKYEKHISL